MTTTPQEIDFSNLLIKSHQESCQNEDQKDQQFLIDHEPVSENHWRSSETPNSFIIRTLLDWDEDEGFTQEDALNQLGYEIKSRHEHRFELSNDWEVEEIREGYYWSLYRVTFK
jgi:hypothetical protein